MEITALTTRGKVFFDSFIINDYAETVLAAFYIRISSQLIRCGSILSEHICKKKFYFIDSVGNVEAIALNVVAKSLKQGTVVGILNLRLTVLAFSAYISPTALRIGLVRYPGKLTFIGSIETVATYIDGKLQTT